MSQQIREKKPGKTRILCCCFFPIGKRICLLEELQQELNDLHVELIRLTIANNKSHQIENVRQSIAQIHLVRNQTTKENLRKFYQGEKYKPKDLRSKQTRAMRRQLTAEEESSSLAKQRRKNCAFPQRTFAVKE